jgi:hypothetical protein
MGARRGPAAARLRTGIARPGQQAAREGPMEPREGAGMVARPWEVVRAQLGAAALMAWWSGGVGTSGENVRHLYSGASLVTSR